MADHPLTPSRKNGDHIAVTESMGQAATSSSTAINRDAAVTGAAVIRNSREMAADGHLSTARGPECLNGGAVATADPAPAYRPPAGEGGTAGRIGRDRAAGPDLGGSLGRQHAGPGTADTVADGEPPSAAADACGAAALTVFELAAEDRLPCPRCDAKRGIEQPSGCDFEMRQHFGLAAPLHPSRSVATFSFCAATEALRRARENLRAVRALRHLTGDRWLDTMRGPERYAAARAIALASVLRCRAHVAEDRAELAKLGVTV